MSYIFLDESGDLGFDFSKKGTSDFFIITCLITNNKRPIEKAVAKTHADLKKKHKKRGGVLHCFREKPITRERLLRRLAQKDCLVMAIYMDKSRVYTRLQDEKIILYNYVTNILLDRICRKIFLDSSDKIELIASRKETNKFLNENFRNYLTYCAKQRHDLDIRIKIKMPGQEKSLQAVDFASWAIFRKYQYGDDRYYNVIRRKILEENPLFP